MKSSTINIECQDFKYTTLYCQKDVGFYCYVCKIFICANCKGTKHDGHSSVFIPLIEKQEQVCREKIQSFFTEKNKEIKAISLTNKFYKEYKEIQTKRIDLESLHLMNENGENNYEFIKVLKLLISIEKKIFDKVYNKIHDRTLDNQSILKDNLIKGIKITL